MSNSVRPHRRQPTRLPRPWDSPGKNTGVGCHFLLQCMKVKSESEVAQLCPTLSDPVDCSLPGSSVHGIFQARALEWAAIAFSGRKVLGRQNSKTSIPQPCVRGSLVLGKALTAWANAQVLQECREGAPAFRLVYASGLITSKNCSHGRWFIKVPCCKQQKPSLVNLNQTDLIEKMWENRWGNSGHRVRLYFWGLHNHCRWWLQPWN